MARTETGSSGTAEAGSTLPKLQDVRREGWLPKEKVLSKKSTVEWADNQSLWRGQKSSLGV